MQYRLDASDLSAFLDALRGDNREVVAPTVDDDAIVYAPIAGAADLPRGVHDEQGPGRYRIVVDGDDAYFDHAVGPHAWKRFLQPPEQRIFSAHGGDNGFTIEETEAPAPPRVFFGVRACDLSAIHIFDRVFAGPDFTDTGYAARRAAALIVVVHCARPAETCFCTSMNTGPRASDGFDLALSEVPGNGDGGGYFIVEAATQAGEAVLSGLDFAPASQHDIQAADDRIEAAAAAMQRAMIPDAAEVLGRNLTAPHWERIASRCLNCANCTMACPTCFCSTVEDVTDLSGQHAERWRKWDSCFTLDFSYIHGGSLRRSGGARYRQWMTHKLLHWHEQFDSSGCVGCGRCITWCPVGIDITEEAQAIKDEEGRA